MQQANQSVKIVCISDTHGQQDLVKLPSADILIHAGDFTYNGNTNELYRFCDWLDKQTQIKHKIVIAGNHEFTLDEKSLTNARRRRVRDHKLIDQCKARMLKSCIYLENQEVLVEGLRFYGSPLSIEYGGGAFQEEEEDLLKLLETIPQGLDFLITHGPPHSILDANQRKENCGSEAIAYCVLNKIQPKFHIFGHIHESHGQQQIGKTHFFNVSTCNKQYQIFNKPVEINYNRPNL